MSLFSIGLYLPTLQFGFVYDDKFQILENRWITDIKYLPDIFFSSVWSFDTGATSNIYRPLQHVIYMLEYYLFGLKPWGYHLVNILFHTVNTVLVFFLTSFILKSKKKLGSEPLSGENTLSQQKYNKENFYPISLAFLSALLFAAHPINTESVAWIGTIPELSMTSMYLLSFLLYATCSPGINTRFILSVILFLVACLLKEPALTLLLIILLYDYSRNGFKSVIKQYRRYIAYFIVAIGYLILRFYALGGFTVRQNLKMGIDQLILNIFPLFFQYIKKLVLPYDLRAMYDFYPVSSLTEWTVLGTMVFTLIVLIFWYFFKERDHLIFMALSFIIVPLIPVFYLPAMRDTVFAERYLYLSSFGFVMIVSYSLKNIYLYFNKNRLDSKIVGTGFTVLSLMILMIYAFATGKRQPVWKSDLSLWTDTVKKSPDSYVAHNDLGIALGKEGNFKEAIEHFSRAQQIKTDYAEAQNNMGNALYGIGKIEEAISYYTEALQSDPDFAKAHFNLGFIFAQQGRTIDAIPHYNEVIRVKPSYLKAHYYLGAALESLGDIEKSILHYQEALSLSPNGIPVLKKLAWIFATHENPKFRNGSKAVQLAEQANQLTGGNQPVNMDILAAAYAEAGRFNEAVQTAKKAIRLAEDNKQKELTGEINHRLKMYESGRPFRNVTNNK